MPIINDHRTREVTRLADAITSADHDHYRTVRDTSLKIAALLAQEQIETDDLKLFKLAMHGPGRERPEVTEFYDNIIARYGNHAAGQPIATLTSGNFGLSEYLGRGNAQIGSIALVPKPERGKSAIKFRFEDARTGGRMAVGTVGVVVLPVVLRHTWASRDTSTPVIQETYEQTICEVLRNGAIDDGFEHISRSASPDWLKVGYNEILAARDLDGFNPRVEDAYLQRVMMARTAFAGYQAPELE